MGVSKLTSRLISFNLVTRVAGECQIAHAAEIRRDFWAQYVRSPSVPPSYHSMHTPNQICVINTAGLQSSVIRPPDIRCLRPRTTLNYRRSNLTNSKVIAVIGHQRRNRMTHVSMFATRLASEGASHCGGRYRLLIGQHGNAFSGYAVHDVLHDAW